jgi:fused signal recognition particle receptor
VSNFEISLVLLISLVGGIGLISVGVLIEFSLRKKLPAPPSRAAHPAVETAQPSLPESIASDEAAATPSQIETAPPIVIHTRTRPVEAKVVVERSASVEPEPASTPAVLRPPMGLGLRKTRESFLARLRAAISGKAKIDEIYEGLEEALIAADVGVEASMKLVEGIRRSLGSKSNPDLIRDALKTEIIRMLEAAERPPADANQNPLVIMLVGVNGVGKTTTVAKLAALLKANRGGVLVAAADTFRAAAVEQLEVWCNRVGADLIKQNQGSDPAAVAFDAVKAALARKSPTLLIDTAGRLQTKVNLMEELKKVARVVGRELPGAPHETWLVLDANTGQNALSQAKLFGEAVRLTGVILAKLDSTAKGGIIVGIAERLKLPVRFVGIGEGLEDLREFDSREFVDALFDESDQAAAAASRTYAA